MHRDHLEIKSHKIFDWMQGWLINVSYICNHQSGLLQVMSLNLVSANIAWTTSHVDHLNKNRLPVKPKIWQCLTFSNPERIPAKKLIKWTEIYTLQILKTSVQVSGLCFCTLQSTLDEASTGQNWKARSATSRLKEREMNYDKWWLSLHVLCHDKEPVSWSLVHSCCSEFIINLFPLSSRVLIV